MAHVTGTIYPGGGGSAADEAALGRDARRQVPDHLLAVRARAPKGNTPPSSGLPVN